MTPRRPRTPPKPAHRSNARGSFVIDRRITGVGRLKRATGTTDPAVYRLYNGMVDTLIAAGRLDILRSLQAGSTSFAEVWDVVRPHADRPVDLNRLPAPETMRRLWGDDEEDGAFAAFVAGLACSDSHRMNLRRDGRNLRAVAPKEATVRDLPAVLKKYRVRCITRERARSFNMARTTVQAFLRETVGRFHPLYVAVAELRPLAERRQAGRPMTPAEAGALRDRLRVLLSDKYADAMWAMCVTGMRPAEYWGAWEPQGDRLRIRNAKQKGQRAETWREIPLVAPIAPPRIAFTTFRDQLWKKGVRDHTAYDGRRTFATAMEAAGIPRARRKLYLGHGVRDVTDLYERHQVAAFLAEDGEKLRRHFGLDTPGGPALRLAR